MLYLTLEKIPELTGLGPWMGVVQGEQQVSSDYPEEEKVSASYSAVVVSKNRARSGVRHDWVQFFCSRVHTR